MIKRLHLYALIAALLFAGVAHAQKYPLADKIADKIIQKYTQSTCEQLWQEKKQPKSDKPEKAIQALRDDADLRAYFLNKVAPPIANKMFECGMIP